MKNDFLLNLYQNATYTVYPPLDSNHSSASAPLSLKVGKKIDFSFWFPEISCKAHLISACNPFSIPLSMEENEVRQNFLANQLSTAGLIFWQGLGHDKDYFWVEPSWLVWNATEKQIEQWMWAWQQLAWLEIDSKGIVHLREQPKKRAADDSLTRTSSNRPGQAPGPRAG